MTAGGVIIVEELGEKALEVRLVQDNHVIEAFPSERADHSLGVRILPRAPRRRRPRPQPARSPSAAKGFASDVDFDYNGDGVVDASTANGKLPVDSF
jgi:hypothetical protein